MLIDSEKSLSSVFIMACRFIWFEGCPGERNVMRNLLGKMECFRLMVWLGICVLKYALEVFCFWCLEFHYFGE